MQAVRKQITLVLIGLLLTLVGLHYRSPSPEEFEGRVQQINEIRIYMQTLWRMRKECNKANFEEFKRDATALGHLTGTTISVSLEADSSVDVVVTKNVEEKARPQPFVTKQETMWARGDFAAKVRLGGYQHACGEING